MIAPRSAAEPPEDSQDGVMGGPCRKPGSGFRVLRRGCCACGVALVLGGVFPATARGDGGAEPAAGPSARLREDARRPLGLPKGAPNGSAAPETAGLTGGAGRTVMSLMAVLGLLGLVAFSLRRLARSHGGLLGAAGPGGRAPAGILEVLGRYPLARGQTLILLKLDRRVLLLSQSGGGRLGGAAVSTLCEITDPDEVASILVRVRDEEGDSMARRFQAVLGRADRATAEALGDGQPGRRTTLSPSGDSVELWGDAPGASASAARGFAASEPVDQSGARTGAEVLRGRLEALRRLGGPGGGTRP